MHVQAVAVAPGLLVSLFTAILALLALPNRDWSMTGCLALIALLASLPGLWVYRWLSRFEQRKLSAYWSCGPRELWPFFSETEYQEARS